MKKKIGIFIFILLFCLLFTIPGFALDVSAKSAVLMECDSGNIIYSKNADEKLEEASTTKIMTCLVALENGNLNELITANDKSTGIEGTSAYIIPGESYTLEQLLYMLMLQSANDAAETIAIGISGNEKDFVSLMNSKCEELELDSTHFMNPHGLSEEGHYTSAKDLANITRYALQNDTFAKIVKTKSYKIDSTEHNSVKVLSNHNKMLKMYDGCSGVKTGFTKKAGRCLVSSAERDGVKLVCVTLNAPDDWNDHTKLLNFGFSKYKNYTLCEENSILINVPLVNGEYDYLKVTNNEKVALSLPSDAELSYKIYLPRFVFAPVGKNEKIGYIVYYNGESEIARVSLFSTDVVNQKQDKKSKLEKIKEKIWKK